MSSAKGISTRNAARSARVIVAIVASNWRTAAAVLLAIVGVVVVDDDDVDAILDSDLLFALCCVCVFYIFFGCRV
jgi:hypothetical protein